MSTSDDAHEAGGAQDFRRACAAADVAEGESVVVAIGAWEVLVCRSSGRIYAVENRCSHRDEKLSGGRIRRGQIICPAHGARFDLATGASYTDQLTRTPICVFATRITNDGDVEVLAPGAPSPLIPERGHYLF